jgi:hypothetical protein
MSVILQWKKNLTSTFSDIWDSPKPSVTIDTSGNIYVAYVCVTPSEGQTHIGEIDVCIVKFDPSGTALWFRQQPSFDTTKDDVDPDICVDEAGNVYVTYCSAGTVSGAVERGFNDIVVFKLNSNGDTLWVTESSQFNAGGNNFKPQIAVDDSGNVYVAYYSNDPSSPETYYDNVCYFKLSPEGSLIWVKKTVPTDFNTNGGNYNPVIDVDESGNCYIAYFSDGYGDPVAGETNVGGSDIIVFKTDMEGNILWMRQRPVFDTADNDVRPSIVVDINGNSYITYYTSGVIPGQSATGGLDIVVFKIDTNGTTVWATQTPSFNTTLSDSDPSIGIDALGRIYVTYSTYGTLSGQIKTGEPDIAIILFDNDGNVLTILQQGSFNTQYENIYPNIAVDQQGNFVIVYYSVNPGALGGSTSQDLIIFKMNNLICVTGDTSILMADGSTKLIKHIKRGDVVAPNHPVARLCMEKIDYSSKIDLVIFEENCLGNRPDKQLVITPNHPIFYKNARRPAKCFEKCPGVTLIENTPISQVTDLLDTSGDIYLYDLQFDHDGSYIANGVEIQSRSPYSYYGPLPKELYFDQTLYCPDQVWDCSDHLLPLDMTCLNFNLIMLKNKIHTQICEKQSKTTDNLIIYKNGKKSTDERNSTLYSIVKYPMNHI